MTEVLFLVTTIFVAYVVYVIVNEKKAGQDSAKPVAAPSPSTATKTATLMDKPKAAAPLAQPKAKAPAAKASPAKTAVVAKSVPEKPVPVAKVPAVKAAAKKPVASAKTAAPKAAVVKLPTEKPPAPPVAAKSPAKPAAPAKTPAKKAQKPVTAMAETVAPAVPAASQTLKNSGLKDPKTGEISKTYSNYRFAKRWIKEALVAEKLVDKVYKNEEINADIDSKIKAGLIQLENMKKYQP
jgi:hypothetical protein